MDWQFKLFLAFLAACVIGSVVIAAGKLGHVSFFHGAIVVVGSRTADRLCSPGGAVLLPTLSMRFWMIL